MAVSKRADVARAAGAAPVTLAKNCTKRNYAVEIFWSTDIYISVLVETTGCLFMVFGFLPYGLTHTSLEAHKSSSIPEEGVE